MTVLATVTVTITSAMVAWGFALLPVPRAQPPVRPRARDDDAPRRGDDDPDVPHLGLASGRSAHLTPLWAGNLFGSAFYIFLLRQFFLGLPRDLFEAAKIDGANNWQIFSRIALPLTKPALVVVALFEFQAAWTDLMRPLIYLRDSDTFTVPRGLKSLLDQFGFGGEWHWEIIVTASVITTVPMIILFFLGPAALRPGHRHHRQQGLMLGA